MQLRNPHRRNAQLCGATTGAAKSMKWPHEDVQEKGAKYPPGLYKLKVSEQTEDTDRNGCFVILSHCRIGVPTAMKNQPFTLRFRIGVTQGQADGLRIETGEDLDAENEATWKGNPSARDYKSYLKALGVVSTGDTVEEAEDAKGKVFFVQLGEKNGYDNYERFYRDGEAPEAVAEPARPAKSALKPTAAKAAKPSKPAPAEEPVEEDDDWA